ncbi:golgin subfamily A member 6-like protein 7 [Palaemon carinicauda]|uniref:golgin subfamily A member 6-like protein 7 n=1 Tax=Palaemon carinicauda TaxID=392227 RepID=UPI0035B61037
MPSVAIRMSMLSEIKNNQRLNMSVSQWFGRLRIPPEPINVSRNAECIPDKALKHPSSLRRREEQIKESVVRDFNGYEYTQCLCEERNDKVEVRRKEEEKRTKPNGKNQRQEEEKKIIIPKSEEELDEEIEELKREKKRLKECIRRFENQVVKENIANNKKIERFEKELLHHHNQKEKENGREEKEKKKKAGMQKKEQESIRISFDTQRWEEFLKDRKEREEEYHKKNERSQEEEQAKKTTDPNHQKEQEEIIARLNIEIKRLGFRTEILHERVVKCFRNKRKEIKRLQMELRREDKINARLVGLYGKDEETSSHLSLESSSSHSSNRTSSSQSPLYSSYSRSSLDFSFSNSSLYSSSSHSSLGCSSSHSSLEFPLFLNQPESSPFIKALFSKTKPESSPFLNLPFS